MFVYAQRLEESKEGGGPPDKGIALWWYIKAANTGHAMAQHRVAIMYGEGIQPFDEADSRKKMFHTLPSVATWAISVEAARRLGKSRTFTDYPSVIPPLPTARLIVEPYVRCRAAAPPMSGERPCPCPGRVCGIRQGR